MSHCQYNACQLTNKGVDIGVPLVAPYKMVTNTNPCALYSSMGNIHCSSDKM